MQKLLHTLYVTQPNLILSEENRNLTVLAPDGSIGMLPLLPIEKIVILGSSQPTPELMSFCASQGIGLYALHADGSFRYSVHGAMGGGTELRRSQYTMDDHRRLHLAKQLISGKLHNCSTVLSRFAASHPTLTATPELSAVAASLREQRKYIEAAETDAELRGLEGSAAGLYFSMFDSLLLTPHPELHFSGRNRRPPQDCCNALLSLAYSLLAADCQHGLECAGLDPYLGLLHTERPGRASLALDLMEEMRPLLADRFVLRLINLQMLTPVHFEACKDRIHLNRAGSDIFFREWAKYRKRTLYMPDLDAAVPYGLLPIVQAQQLAAAIRNGEGYTPVSGRPT